MIVIATPPHSTNASMPPDSSREPGCCHSQTQNTVDDSVDRKMYLAPRAARVPRTDAESGTAQAVKSCHRRTTQVAKLELDDPVTFSAPFGLMGRNIGGALKRSLKWFSKGAKKLGLKGRDNQKQKTAENIEARLESQLRLRTGTEKPAVAEAHREALATAKQTAAGGGTIEQVRLALDRALNQHKGHTTREERRRIKFAALAQVCSEHYTAAWRYHGGEQARFSPHNLPKGVIQEIPEIDRLTPRQADSAMGRLMSQYRDPLLRARTGFDHIEGRTKASPFVSVAENPAAFARLKNPSASRIAGKAPARTSYLIPDQFLMKPAEIEDRLYASPETAQILTDFYKTRHIFFPDRRTGRIRLYRDDAPTIAVNEGLYLGDRHIDHYAIDRTANPYRNSGAASSSAVNRAPDI